MRTWYSRPRATSRTSPRCRSCSTTSPRRTPPSRTSSAHYTVYLRAHAKFQLDRVQARADAAAGHAEKIIAAAATYRGAVEAERQAETERDARRDEGETLQGRLAGLKNSEEYKAQGRIEDKRREMLAGAREVAGQRDRLDRDRRQIGEAEGAARKLTRRAADGQERRRSQVAARPGRRRAAVRHRRRRLRPGRFRRRPAAGGPGAGGGPPRRRGRDPQAAARRSGTPAASAAPRAGSRRQADRRAGAGAGGAAAAARLARPVRRPRTNWPPGPAAGPAPLALPRAPPRRCPVLSWPRADAEALAEALDHIGEPGATSITEVFDGRTAERQAATITARAHLETDLREVRARLAGLRAERDAIAAEQDDAPPASDLRPARREGRPGAPLWRLVRFADGIGDAEAAADRGRAVRGGAADRLGPP